MGATPYAGVGGTGVTFRVWSPYASSVSVRGDFNGWGTTPLVKEAADDLWSVDVHGARVGQQYQFYVNGNLWRRDPRGRRVTNSNGNSIIYDPAAFDWSGHSFTTPWRNDLVIYEMHVGTYNAEDWVPSSFDKVIERLDHVRDLGFSAIEVMPVNEFPADKSWGYNPADLFAIESALGGPDAFKRFVRACHERGIAVLVDVVHNHYGPTDLALWQFDGWSQNGLGGIYFYNDSARAYTWWGNTRPDFGRGGVRDFIRDHIFMFLEEYKVDGFRWDSVFNMVYYNGGANHNPDGESLLRDINWEMEQTYPEKIRIAEDHAFDFNMNFHGVWDVGFHDDVKWLVTRGSDSERSMSLMAGRIAGNPGHHRVVFSESHDSVGDLNNKHRLPRDIDGSNPWSIWARKRQLLAVGMVLTAPAVPMIFQGQEMNEDWTFSAETALRWSLTNTWSGIVEAYSDMIHVRRNLRGGTQGLKGTGVNVHHVDDVNKVLAFIRWDAGGGSDDVVVVANFAVTKWTNGTYQIEFPSSGTWYSHFNGDALQYGADFGGVGSASVEASGSPPSAPVNMGSYSVQIFSKTPPASAGVATFDPATPAGCVEIAVSYDPAAGPLASATNVVMAVGRNGWQDSADIQLYESGDVWTGAYTILEGTYELNAAFHDGEAVNPVWDNNLGRDWDVPVTSCADLPARVTVNPATPNGCVPVTFTYEERGGPLKDAAAVYVYLGRNNWRDIQSHRMTESSTGVWTYTHPIADDTWQMDFVFHDDATPDRNWDNNGGADWRAFVTGCYDPLIAGIIITNPAGDVTVSNEVVSTTLRGVASSEMTGAFHWTNTLTGFAGSILAATNWTLAGHTLAEGPNTIRISGTNSPANPNQASRDSATNAAYTTPGAWTNGQNGGTSWGGGWQLSAGANGGRFLATTNEHNLSIGPFAWGLWANGGSLSEAVRPFAGRLHVGDIVTLRMDNNWIDTDRSVGFGLQNRFGQSVFEFLFVGGATNYLINDSETTRDTEIPWTGDGLLLEFELTTETGYRFNANGTEIEGTLADSSEAVIWGVRFWNYSAGGGSNYNFYISDMSIDGVPLSSQSFSDEVTITRPFGPNSDPDEDGFVNWQEEIAGTDPFDATSRFPDLQLQRSSGMKVVIPNTTLGRLYDLYVSTNLVTGSWAPLGEDIPGDGQAKELAIDAGAEALFYRSSVRLAE